TGADAAEPGPVDVLDDAEQPPTHPAARTSAVATATRRPRRAARFAESAEPPWNRSGSTAANLVVNWSRDDATTAGRRRLSRTTARPPRPSRSTTCRQRRPLPQCREQ